GQVRGSKQMKVISTVILFIAPLLIYTLGLTSSKYALTGVIIYYIWAYLDTYVGDKKLKKEKENKQC
ncbi:hypothetical protein QQF79_07070, partial [Melissococcus plutonius]|uniref:hypothetical protein n=1 Tax=Melissococcus plutonius TaxID=33970 RepID=UPI003EE454AC